MVTSQKIIWAELMGNRGSKSDFKLESVKEQRVDGSKCVNLTHLRGTLLVLKETIQ